MGILNILKLSFHNLKNNKLRTLLTLVVLSVVSFVVIFLTGVGYSFYASVNENISFIFNKNGTDLSISKYKMEGNNQYQTAFYIEEIDLLLEQLDDGSGYLNSISFFDVDYGYGNNTVYMNSSDQFSFEVQPFYAKSNPFKGKDNYLEAGRMWNASDEGTNHIWLSASMMRYYSVGQTIILSTQTNQLSTSTTVFIIQGFLNTGSNYWQNQAYIEYHQYKNPLATYNPYKQGETVINCIYSSMIPQSDVFYGIKAQTYFRELVSTLQKNELQGGEISVYCEIVSTMTTSVIIVLVIMGLTSFICIIIILLSIGSVANTIKISAEQNRKFFGMMKAIGMKNKSLRQILMGQIILITAAGVAVASGFAYFAIGTAEYVIKSLMTSMFYGGGKIVFCTISPLIPVTVAAVLIGFVLLFTRSSLYQFSKMDVISVINEVN